MRHRLHMDREGPVRTKTAVLSQRHGRSPQGQDAGETFQGRPASAPRPSPLLLTPVWADLSPPPKGVLSSSPLSGVLLKREGAHGTPKHITMASTFVSQPGTRVTSADEMRNHTQPWKDSRRQQSPRRSYPDICQDTPPGSEGAKVGVGELWPGAHMEGGDGGAQDWVLAGTERDPRNEDTGRRWPQEKPALWTP